MTTTTEKRLGLVHNWFEEKGFGFVKSMKKLPDGRAVTVKGERDMFLHAIELRKSGISKLSSGDVVKYNVGEDRSGKPWATDVELAA
jgi:cold shock CspA family protein